jgi:hypothetical protein
MEIGVARSGLWVGCSRTFQFNTIPMVLMVRCAIWGRALSCNKTTPCDNLPLRHVRIADLSQFLIMSQKLALVTLVRLSIQRSKLGSRESQDDVNNSFPAEGCDLNFLQGDNVCFHCIFCHLVSGSQ